MQPSGALPGAENSGGGRAPIEPEQVWCQRCWPKQVPATRQIRMSNNGHLSYCDACGRESDRAVKQLRKEAKEYANAAAPQVFESWDQQPISAAAQTELESMLGARRTPQELREDKPPRLQNCEWRRGVDGWNLWRKVEDGQHRYAGTLTHDRWRTLKEKGAGAGPAQTEVYEVKAISTLGDAGDAPVHSGDHDGPEPAPGGGGGTRKTTKAPAVKRGAASAVLPFKKTAGVKAQAGKEWKKSRVRPGQMIKRIPKHNLVESEYGVTYLFVLSRKPDRTEVDRAKYPLSGYYNWRALEAARLLIQERSEGYERKRATR